MSPLDHFIRLAHAGALNRAASSGQRAAWEIANALCEHLLSLDGLAKEGMLLYMQLRIEHPTDARDLLEHQ